MDNIVLLITLVILVFMTIYGYRKGFVRMAFSLISIILVLMLAGIFAPIISRAISSTSVYEHVREQIEELVEEHIESAAGSTASLGVSAQTEIIESMPIPKLMQESLVKNNTDNIYEDMGVSTFTEYLSEAITMTLMNAIVYIVIFVIVMIAVRAAIKLLDLVAKLPGINFLNRTFGTVFGLAEGVIIIWIGCIVLTAFARTSWAQAAFTEINANAFLTFIYNTNLLLTNI